MEGIINEINKSYPNVTSVIFVFSEYPSIQHSENDITVPRIISFIENSDAEKFKSLATPDFQGTVSHFYINYCWFIKPLRYYYFAFISVSRTRELSSLLALGCPLVALLLVDVVRDEAARNGTAALSNDFLALLRAQPADPATRSLQLPRPIRGAALP